MIKLGIERLQEYIHLFDNKKVGLITNPTGVNQKLESTIDVLHEAVQLTTLFSPEHGVRGNLQAGERLDDYVDPDTGLIVYSLYGATKKPTQEMVQNIDIIAYDIQDVGARFYTYIYTLAYAMMAAKEYHKTVVVFDRPNPVNAVDVEGNLLDTTYRSFIGYYPIPQRYGLTIGELAQLFNNEFSIGCDLKVIPMSGYTRSMDFTATRLPWIFPSPNLPTPNSLYAYLCSCIFEGTNMSEGRGTTKPFEIIGSPYLDHLWLAEELEKQALPGIRFRPLYFTPMFSKHQGILCKGLELMITDKKTFKPITTAYTMFHLIQSHHPSFKCNPPYKEGLHQMIDLNTGCDYIKTQSISLSKQLEILANDSRTFKQMKQRYHIYE